jgi:hypothetical protein
MILSIVFFNHYLNCFSLSLFSFLCHNIQPLHRMREFGSSLKEMDLIDETALSSEQMKAMLAHMYEFFV